MSVAEWTKEVDEIKLLSKSLKSLAGRQALSDAVYKLNRKIKDEQNRLNCKFETKLIDNVKYEIPQCMKEKNFNKFTLKVNGEVLYLIDKRKKMDEDMSYHWYHYAWIPNGNKYTKLLVRTLGGDKYGDRYFAETFHYKHPADDFPYQNRRLALDNKSYKLHIEYILNELDLLGKIKPR
ncbi:hypothetical protein [Paenibacillus oleatilyticus]|uniref:hypothetical protein n=1 Tax=Paenibacillus oleatilyticus TaxID=2594886 RepID=UPI001C1FD721|nr:hypothetical protein [Paenibacillus oleatilyticus]MBU7316012.1 hypothetical protein [Paenibacillus oleatilyticus]